MFYFIKSYENRNNRYIRKIVDSKIVNSKIAIKNRDYLGVQAALWLFI